MRRTFLLMSLCTSCLLAGPSGDADETTAPQDELKAARQRFEEQINTAVNSIRARHITQLEGLQRAMTRRGDAEGALEVKAEVEWLKASARPFKSNPLEGSWEVRYRNRSTRTYLVHPHGKVEHDGRTGQLLVKGDDTLLDFGDRKLERLSLQLIIEHYNPATRYPAQTPSTTGTGMRVAADSNPNE